MGGGGSKEAFKSSITDLINNQQVRLRLHNINVDLTILIYYRQWLILMTHFGRGTGGMPASLLMTTSLSLLDKMFTI